MDPAELLVIDETGHRWMRTAHRALGILLELQFAEPHPERIEDQESPDEWLAYSEDQLDGFGRLDDADDAGQDAEHTTLCAARYESRRRRLRIQAAIAGTVAGCKH